MPILCSVHEVHKAKEIEPIESALLDHVPGTVKKAQRAADAAAKASGVQQISAIILCGVVPELSNACHGIPWNLEIAMNSATLVDPGHLECWNRFRIVKARAGKPRSLDYHWL